MREFTIKVVYRIDVPIHMIAYLFKLSKLYRQWTEFA